MSKKWKLSAVFLQNQANLTFSSLTKAELLQEGIFFLLQLFARDVLVMKKLEIEKTKPTFIISTFKTDIIKVGLVFSISNFFIAKTSLANNWRSFSSSYLALVSSNWKHWCTVLVSFTLLMERDTYIFNLEKEILIPTNFFKLPNYW